GSRFWVLGSGFTESHRERGIGVHRELRRAAGAKFPESCGADHRSIVCGQLDAWDERRNFACVAVRFELRAQAAVCRHTTRYSDAAGPITASRLERAVDQCRDDHTLKTRADVGDFPIVERRGRRLVASSRADERLAVGNVPKHGCLEPTEAEIEIAFEL